MSVTWGRFDDHFERSIYPAQVKVGIVRCSGGVGDVTFTFTLISDELSTCPSVQVQYSTDNSAWSTATGSWGSNLVCSSGGGTLQSKTFDTVTDLGTTILDSTVWLKVRAYDGDSYSEWVSSDSFSVDNRPTMDLISPADGEFGDAFVEAIAEVETNPGTNRLVFRYKSDTVPDFNSVDLIERLVTTDSDPWKQRYTAYTGKKAGADGSTAYYVSRYEVTSVTGTTVDYSSLTDYLGIALPVSITGAKIIVLPRSGRLVWISSESSTQFTIGMANWGEGDSAYCDLLIFSDSYAAEFSSDLAVTSVSFETINFVADLGFSSVPASPTVEITHRNENFCIVDNITDTTFDIKLTSGFHSGDGSVMVCVRNSNSEGYVDPDRVCSTPSGDTYYFETIFVGDSCPALIAGAQMSLLNKADRFSWIDELGGDGFELKTSIMGAEAGKVDLIAYGWNGTLSGASPIWAPMSDRGIPACPVGTQVKYVTVVADGYTYTETYYWTMAAGDLT